MSGELAHAPVRERRPVGRWAGGGRRDDELDVIIADNNLVTWKQSRASSPESQAECIERHTVKAADLADSINGFANKASEALDATG
ncbi:hypothetical protein [Streptomyces sp. NPDC019937]|uniref:hypothetical protein n=1 Tax=Streptomyces sp. NPDC019937 TaxID=3154787 RepID=UPI0033CF3B96